MLNLKSKNTHYVSDEYSMMVVKYCEYCGKQLTQKIYTSGRKEERSNFMGRKFCDMYCQGKSYRVAYEKKYCLYCSSELKRRDDEVSVAYRARRFCNHSCYAKSIMIDNPTDSAVYYRLRNSREKIKCVVCGVTEKLHNHHIDKNIRNNNENNLITLCASCHIRFHAVVRKIERQNVKN